jgi:hypothetical protein
LIKLQAKGIATELTEIVDVEDARDRATGSTVLYLGLGGRGIAVGDGGVDLG